MFASPYCMKVPLPAAIVPLVIEIVPSPTGAPRLITVPDDPVDVITHCPLSDETLPVPAIALIVTSAPSRVEPTLAPNGAVANVSDRIPVADVYVAEATDADGHAVAVHNPVET